VHATGWCRFALTLAARARRHTRPLASAVTDTGARHVYPREDSDYIVHGVVKVVLVPICTRISWLQGPSANTKMSNTAVRPCVTVRGQTPVARRAAPTMPHGGPWPCDEINEMNPCERSASPGPSARNGKWKWKWLLFGRMLHRGPEVLARISRRLYCTAPCPGSTTQRNPHLAWASEAESAPRRPPPPPRSSAAVPRTCSAAPLGPLRDAGRLRLVTAGDR
jgi:hypothetical protein